VSEKKINLLIAASGTGGHLFPALAVAEQLQDYHIEWLGVPNRLETTLVPECYPLHTINMEGFQTKFGLKTFLVMGKILTAIFKVKKILTERKIDLVFSTGGYIAAPAIIAAKLAKIPVIIHESNFIPGKVTKLLAPWCDSVALGFEGTKQYLPKANTTWVSTPVRSQFSTPQTLDLPISPDVPLIVVVGGSQGAIALNKIVRDCAKTWLEKGIIIVHLTGNQDPDFGTLKHENYLEMPFYDNMAALFQRANLAISRSGAGTLAELAITKTPAILIPFPFAAEDHQYYNAKVFAYGEVAYLFRQEDLTTEVLEKTVLDLLENEEKLLEISNKYDKFNINNSAELINNLFQEILISQNSKKSIK
jgi:UDP-N-acetylglucosamine--N-acetylmuramyl-(pentapeptide) pyrophosphoryl-undecaprenol N-acetylglucosamine transferase